MRSDPMSSLSNSMDSRLLKALAIESLEFRWRCAHHATKCAGKMALAIKARRQADLYQTCSRGVQHHLCAFQATLKYITIRGYAQGLFEHAREMMQAQICDFRQLT